MMTNLYKMFKKYNGVIYPIEGKFCVIVFDMGQFGELEEMKNEEVKIIKVINKNCVLSENLYNYKLKDFAPEDTFNTVEEAIEALN